MTDVGEAVWVPEQRCPVCGVALDGATIVGENGTVQPKDGDVTVCVFCAHVLRFGPGLVLYELTHEDLVELAYQDPRQFALLLRVERIAGTLVRDRRRSKARSN